MGIGIKLVSISVVAVLVLTGCCVYNAAGDDDVIIIFTSDVHCAYEDNIGYSGVSAYKQDMEKESRNVMLIDIGDFIQGGVAGTISKGKFMTDFMDRIGYDIVTLGNHEFEYGADNLWKLLKDADFETVCCNISYTGEKDDPMDFIQPYTIREFGYVKIGFVGVSTPTTATTTAQANLMEDGKVVYDFCNDGSGKALYSSVQNSIDRCRSLGATHVILMSHLGDTEFAPYNSVDVVRNTTGLSYVIDGHQHSVIENMKVKDKDGRDVSISATGVHLNYLGCLRITQAGDVSAKLVSADEYTKKDPAAVEYKDSLKAKVYDLVGGVAFTLPVDLPYNDSSGARMIRNQETAIGNVIADAFRIRNDADIGLFTAGGIRSALYKGDVTYYDLLEVMPYMYPGTVIEIDGQTILDALELSCSHMTEETSSGSEAFGESKGFLSVSGLRFDVDASIETPVIVDDRGNYTGMKDTQRRVSNVKVLDSETGVYVDIDPSARYTVSGSDYLLLQYGEGFTMFKGAQIVKAETSRDYIMVAQYMAGLTQEQIAELYSAADGRIVRI